MVLHAGRITGYWRGSSGTGRNGVQSGGGRGLMMTPKNYVNIVHADNLEKAQETERLYKRQFQQQQQYQYQQQQPVQQMKLEGVLKRKAVPPKKVEFQETENVIQQNIKQRKIEEKKKKQKENEEKKKEIMEQFEKQKRDEVMRLRAKRKEYENFLKEKLSKNMSMDMTK